MAKKFNPATEGMLRRPGRPPLPGLLLPVLDWFETRHMTLMAEAGFDDLRRAHNQVAINLPAEGRRLTDLADDANMSKQAMGELVDDLVAKGYLAKVPDPSDGRAKLIVWSERGERSHDATMTAFAQIERELAELFGVEALDALHEGLLALVLRLRSE